MDYYNSPRWSSEAPDCAIPLSFDQYSNCSYKCTYCFSQYQRMMIRGKGRKDYIENKAKFVNVDKVKRLFLNERETQYSEYIKQKKVFQWGGLSDPFCFFEKKYKIGLELLKFFRDIEYPISFSTKGVWWLDNKEYTELFTDNNNWKIKLTIITTDKTKALKIERGAPTPENRLKAIKKINLLNCGGVTLRLRPFIFGLSDLTYLDLIKQAFDYGADSLSTEFFCFDYRLRSNNLETINKVIGFDCTDFYKKFSFGKGCPLRLNRNVKRKYIDNMENLCAKLGMKFFVSDCNFKERSFTGCCCGLDSSFNYSRGQFAEALVICKKEKRVKWKDISYDMNHFRKVKYTLNNEPCERRSYFIGFTVYDYLKYLWNNPEESQSPYKIFEGIMVPIGKDKEGNLIYGFNIDRA